MWNPECAITEPEAIVANNNNVIKSLRIVKEGDSFYILMRLTWRKEELYLSTTRSTKEPRHFKNLDRLIEYIMSNYDRVETLNLVLKQGDAESN